MVVQNIKNTIPIVLASDDNYAPYLYTALLSILTNKHQETYYKFFIMVPEQFSIDNQFRINDLHKFYKNFDISYINMKDCFKDIKLQIKHISYITYYRLLIPQILNTFDKCIYLDIDVLVNNDLSELYNTELENNYIAGVRTPNYHINQNRLLKFQNKLGLPDLKQYVNAGILVMNLKKMREDKLVYKFLELINRNFPTQDQDIINVACYGKIKHVPLKYNCSNFTFTKYKTSELNSAYHKQELYEAATSPCIIHFSDKLKPWNNPTIPMANLWWDYTRTTPYYEGILYKNIHQITNRNSNKKLFYEKVKKLFNKIELLIQKSKYFNHTKQNEQMLEKLIQFSSNIEIRLETQCQTM